MEDSFTPLGLREGWISDNGPYEGVPAHLQQSLLDWISDVFYRTWWTGYSHSSSFNYELLQQAERRVQFSSGIVRATTSSAFYSARQRLRTVLASDEQLFLSVIDFLLWKGVGDADAMDGLLMEGGSIYKVADTSGSLRLERRVEPSLDSQAKALMAKSGAASDLLKVAWSAALGIHPNPSEGFRNAVRAVEAAAIPIVLPNDATATLGKVIGHLDSNDADWEFVLPERRDGQASVRTVIDNMGTLWNSQYDRHVTAGVPLHVSQSEAEAALVLAAVLIQWLESGSLKKR